MLFLYASSWESPTALLDAPESRQYPGKAFCSSYLAGIFSWEYSVFPGKSFRDWIWLLIKILQFFWTRCPLFRFASHVLYMRRFEISLISGSLIFSMLCCYWQLSILVFIQNVFLGVIIIFWPLLCVFVSCKILASRFSIDFWCYGVVWFNHSISSSW